MTLRDARNARRYADELVMRYGQTVAAEKAEREYRTKPTDYWDAVRQRVAEPVPREERHPIMARPV